MPPSMRNVPVNGHSATAADLLARSRKRTPTKTSRHSAVTRSSTWVCCLTLCAHSKFRSFWPRVSPTSTLPVKVRRRSAFPREFWTRLGCFVAGSPRFHGCRKINPDSNGGPIDISYRDYLKNRLQNRFGKVGCFMESGANPLGGERRFGAL